MVKKTIVLDTCIIELSNNPESDKWEATNELLMGILRICHKIAIDENQILSEYSKHMRSDHTRKELLFNMFFKKMMQRNKVIFYSIDNSPIPINMDKNDIKFVKVASRTYDKIIVSEDSDFLNDNTKKTLSKVYGITVYSVEEALENLKEDTSS